MIAALMVAMMAVSMAASANVIVNGSFEDQQSQWPADWRGNIDPFGAWYVDNAWGAIDGEYVAVCDAPDGDGICWFWTLQEIPAGDYTLSAWTNPVTWWWPEPQALYFDLGGDVLVFPLEAGWTHIEKNVTVTTPAPLRIGALNYRDDGLLLDDVRMVAVPEARGLIVMFMALGWMKWRRYFGRADSV